MAMAWRSIFGHGLRSWCRAVAVLAACAFAAQSAQLPMLAAAEAATCCCPHRTAEDACGCPVCAHRRLLEAGCPVVETCGAGTHAPAIATLDAAVLPPAGCITLVPARAVPALPVVSAPPEPAAEVPTPPPLARG
jgi:hypothetical protein